MRGLFLPILLSIFFTCCNGQCNSGWTRHENSCYLYFHEPYTFFEAKVACDIARAHMVEIESASENNFIKNLAVSNHEISVWIGLQDFIEEGMFQWSYSLNKPVYTAWAPGDPNSFADAEDCVVLRVTATNGLWMDIHCETRYPFVCETNATNEEPIG